MSNRQVVFDVMKKIVAEVDHLSPWHRKILFTALLAQEICMLPPSERADEIDHLLINFRRFVQATELGMRQALAENARDGL